MPSAKKLHVACSPLTGAIYAGTLDATGSFWLNKRDLTGAAVGAVCEHVMLNKGELEVKLNGKPKFKIMVEEITE